MYFLILFMVFMMPLSFMGMNQQESCDLFSAIYDYGSGQQFDTKEIKRLLDEKSDPNFAHYRSGAAPLDWAIGFDKKYHQPLIKILLESKADFNRKAMLRPCLTIFEYFLLEQNNTFSQKGIALFLTHKADPCKKISSCECPEAHEYVIPVEGTLPYEHVIQLKSERTMLLDAMLEKIFPLSCKKMVTTFLLCMKTAKKPLLHDTKLTLKHYQVPPKAVQYLILKMAPFIAVKKSVNEIGQKDVLSECEAKELKNSLLCAVQQYLNN